MPDHTDNFLENIRRRKAQQATAVESPPAPPAAASRNGDSSAYVDAAYRAEIGELQACPNGSRNHTLNIVALKLARLPVDRNQLHNDLVQACHTNSLIRDDGRPSVDATIKSAYAKADLDGPREIPEPKTSVNVTIVNADQITTPTENDNYDYIWGAHQPVCATDYLLQHDTATSLWGSGDDVLWAEGEALMIAGGMGLGKTTIAGQIIRAQLGLPPHDVLGLPVEPVDGPILYLAMDRPRQIRRSMLRQFDPLTESGQLNNLLIRIGPPVADIAARPTLLLEMAQACGAAAVYVDSLKDAAIGLSDDKVGAAYNRARQHLLADNRQLCELHHNRKAVAGINTTSSVSEVYGSTWLTSGAGSVIMLTGEPGDPIIEFRHVKQPLNELGPWRLLNNPTIGQMIIDHNVDLLDLVAVCGAHGLTAQGAATTIFEKEKPTRAQVEKARYRLNKLVDTHRLTRVEGVRGGGIERTETAWFLADVQSETRERF